MKKIIIPIIVVILLLLMIVRFTNKPTKTSLEGVSSTTLSRYIENEVREYEGARLDPSIGPRDNSIQGVEIVSIDDYRLKLTGLVGNPIDLNYSDVLALDAHERKITLYCVEGWDASILWKGVLLKDIMDLAGIDPKANTAIFML